MSKVIEPGFMAFVKNGSEGIGAVREVGKSTFTLYVENAGEFELPRAAILDVHSSKVVLDASQLPKKLLAAIGHAHDSEDPKLAG